MAEIKYTETQIQELRNNKYVKNCTNKNITFTKECKLIALDLERQLMLRKEIFEKLWFPEYVSNSEIPTKSIDRWKRNINKNWIIEKIKWRPRKEKLDFNNMTKDEYIKYLETKLAVFEELKKYADWNFP